MFAVSVVFTIKPDHASEFRELILQHAAQTLEREEACRRFDVGFDADDPTRIFLYELYDDKDAFELHSRTEYLADFFKTAGNWIVGKEANRWELA